MALATLFTDLLANEEQVSYDHIRRSLNMRDELVALESELSPAERLGIHHRDTSFDLTIDFG